MKPLLRASISVLVCSIAWSHAVLLRSTVKESNNTFLSLPINAPLPPTPPGFKVVPIFLHGTPLEPVGVYMVIIELMSALSTLPWAGKAVLSKAIRATSPGGRVAVQIYRDDPELQPGHIILALYDVVLTMYDKRPGFYKVTGNVFLQERRIATMFMFESLPRRALSARIPDKMAGFEGTKRTTSLVNSTIDDLTGPSGEVVDPEDPRFRISWAVDGRSIPVQEIFSAVVDGIATTAQSAYVHTCSHTTGVSFSGNAAFHIGQYGDERLLCGQIIKAFGLLVELVVKDQRQFHEMDFSLSYEGVKIGEGYLLKISSVGTRGGNATGDVAAS